jgi:hypothetical protein
VRFKPKFITQQSFLCPNKHPVKHLGYKKAIDLNASLLKKFNYHPLNLFGFSPHQDPHATS